MLAMTTTDIYETLAMYFLGFRRPFPCPRDIQKALRGASCLFNERKAVFRAIWESVEPMPEGYILVRLNSVYFFCTVREHTKTYHIASPKIFIPA